MFGYIRVSFSSDVLSIVVGVKEILNILENRNVKVGVWIDMIDIWIIDLMCVLFVSVVYLIVWFRWFFYFFLVLIGFCLFYFKVWYLGRCWFSCFYWLWV